MSEQNEKAKNTIMLEVVTPYHHFYEGKVEEVVLSALDGQYGILPGHAPVVLALTPGITHMVINGETRYAMMTEGYAEVGPFMAVVVCNAAEWAEDIDVKRAFSAYQRADQRFHDENLPNEERLFARHSARRARMRIKMIANHGTDEQKATLKRLQGGT
jgi:F-type H+-transporting ATPase subunit epsilon